MSYRLEPHRPVHQSVRKIAASQIEDLIAEHGNGAASPVAVHEARKVLKRLRALLSLIRQGLGGDELAREKERLRGIAGTLAGARDAYVMIETATMLQNGAMPRNCKATAEALMTLLEARRADADAEAGSDDRGAGLPVDALQEAREALKGLHLDAVGFGEVLNGFVKTYGRGRKLQVEAAESGADSEGFHDLRKQVQQHWRHLQLLSNSWPKALRPQIVLAHELAEVLGKDHDLAVLADFVREHSGQIGPAKGIDAYLRQCAAAQHQLRARAEVLARRLYAEKPKALGDRIRVYWETAKAMGKFKAQDKGASKELALIT
jgi:CHAD domain-containing protein